MRVPALALALTVSSVTLQAQTVLSRGSVAPVTVFTRFEGEYSPAAFDVMKTEIDAVMEPSGLRFEWRPLDGPRNGEAAAELVVVTFKGSCRAIQMMRPLTEGSALAWTHTSDGVVLPFAEVDCDNIGRFIGHNIAAVPLAGRDRLLGRAMGRVLAHEFYHIFARTRRHGKTGIAKPFYTASELLSDHFAFAQKESGALRRLVLPGLIRAGAPMPGAAALRP